jgi:hypothetical protein
MISTSKIFIRIKQIQNSIEQARTMLESMEKFKNIVVKIEFYFYLKYFLYFISAGWGRTTSKTVFNYFESRRTTSWIC